MRVLGNLDSFVAIDLIFFAVTPADAPQAVTALRTTPGDQELVAQWTPATDFGGGTFERYEVFLRESGSAWPTTPTTTLTGELDDTVTFTGLTNGTAYDVKVVTISTANAQEIESKNLAEALGVPFTVPDEPASLTLTPLSPTSFVASWNIPLYNGGAPITGYVVSPECQRDNPMDTVCVVTGLAPGSRVTFSVAATNFIGTGDALTAQILLPGGSANTGNTNNSASSRSSQPEESAQEYALAATGPNQSLMLWSVGLGMLLLVAGATAVTASRSRSAPPVA